MPETEAIVSRSIICSLEAAERPTNSNDRQKIMKNPIHQIKEGNRHSKGNNEFTWRTNKRRRNLGNIYHTGVLLRRCSFLLHTVILIIHLTSQFFIAGAMATINTPPKHHDLQQEQDPTLEYSFLRSRRQQEVNNETTSEFEETEAPTASNSPIGTDDEQLTEEESTVGVVDILALYADVSTLVDKMTSSGLRESTLQGDGTFTLLAPTNAAFEEIDLASLDLPEFQPHLVDLLSYHVIPQVVLSNDFLKDTGYTTLNSYPINVTSDNPVTLNNNGASLETSDLLADNGVVHIINQVLLPPSYTLDMIGTIILDPDLSILMELLTAADLIDTLSSPGGPWTLFAPTNAAWEALLDNYLELENNVEELVDLLSDHVTAGVFVARDLEDNTVLEMYNGHMATTTLNPSLRIENANIVATNRLCNNGVLHLVDAVLSLDNSTTTTIPPNTTEATIPPNATDATIPPNSTTNANLTVLDVATNDNEYSMLLNLLDKTGMVEMLQEDGPWTLFAPNNSAFALVDMTRLNKPEYMPHLMDLLEYHIIPDEILLSNDIVLYDELEPLNGGMLNVTSVDPIPTLNYRSQLVQPELLLADNGVVHGIDHVLLPPSYLYDVIGVAVLEPDLSVLVELLSSAQMFDILREPGPFTVFAPPDAVFAGLDPDQSLVNLSGPVLADILNNHVALGIFVADDFEEGMVITMLNGKTYNVTVDPVLKVGPAGFLDTDVLVYNGVIHLIDTILGSGGDEIMQTGTNETRPVADSVWQILVDNLNVILFRFALQSVNIDKLFLGVGSNFTVFAPTSEALHRDEGLQFYTDNLESWVGHVTNILNHHIVQGESFLSQDLWNGFAGDVISPLSGAPLVVDTIRQTIGGENIQNPDWQAMNGVVHEIGGVLDVGWRNLTIVQVLEESAVQTYRRRHLQLPSRFENLIASINSWSPELGGELALLIENPGESNGTTMVAPDDSSFDSMVFDLLMYHIIDFNIYSSEFVPRSYLFAPTRHSSLADMLISVDESGNMRFNDASVQQELLANNGVVYVIDKVLYPPYIMDSLELSSRFTDINVTYLHDLFMVVGLDEGNLSSSVGTYEGQRFTLLAPADSNFEYSLTAEERERLLSPLWSRHAKDLLMNLIAPSALTVEDLTAQVESNWGWYSLEMIGGHSYSVYSSPDLTINSGIFLGPTPNCVDGIIHFVDGIVLPPSMSRTILEVLRYDNMSGNFTLYLEQSELYSKINDAPLTVFVPTDDMAFAGPIPEAKREEFLQNHIFDTLLFTDDLTEMDGEYIYSINGNEWLIEALDGGIFLSSDTVERVALPMNGDILARNGILHYIDALLLEPPEPTPSPTMPSTSSPGQMQSTQSPGSPPLTVSVSFLAYNEENLTAYDLATGDFARTLNKAFYEFIATLVASMETRFRSRRLTVLLRPGGSQINAVLDIMCPRNDTIPAGASCHNVSGQYDLIWWDEDRDAVATRYEVAARNAIQNGKFQEIVDKTDPNFPFTVTGIAVADAPVEKEDNQTMVWWQILFIVIGCVFGASGLCCIAAYFVTRPHKTMPDPNEDAEIQAPLTEASVHMLDVESAKEPSEASSSKHPTGDETDENPEQCGDDSSSRQYNNDAHSVVDVEEEAVPLVKMSNEKSVDSDDWGKVSDGWEDDAFWGDGDQQRESVGTVTEHKVTNDEADGPIVLGSDKGNHYAEVTQERQFFETPDVADEGGTREDEDEDERWYDAESQEVHNNRRLSPIFVIDNDEAVAEPQKVDGNMSQAVPIDNHDDDLDVAAEQWDDEEPQLVEENQSMSWYVANDNNDEEAAYDEAEQWEDEERHDIKDEQRRSGNDATDKDYDSGDDDAAASAEQWNDEEQLDDNESQDDLAEDTEIMDRENINVASNIATAAVATAILATGQELHDKEEQPGPETLLAASDQTGGENTNEKDENGAKAEKGGDIIPLYDDKEDQLAGATVLVALDLQDTNGSDDGKDAEAETEQGNETPFHDESSLSSNGNKVLMDDISNEKIVQWEDDPTDELKMEHTNNTGVLLGMEHAHNMNKLDEINVRHHEAELENSHRDWLTEQDADTAMVGTDECSRDDLMETAHGTIDMMEEAALDNRDDMMMKTAHETMVDDHGMLSSPAPTMHGETSPASSGDAEFYDAEFYDANDAAEFMSVHDDDDDEDDDDELVMPASVPLEETIVKDVYIETTEEVMAPKTLFVGETNNNPSMLQSVPRGPGIVLRAGRLFGNSDNEEASDGDDGAIEELQTELAEIDRRVSGNPKELERRLHGSFGDDGILQQDSQEEEEEEDKEMSHHDFQSAPPISPQYERPPPQSVMSSNNSPSRYHHPTTSTTHHNESPSRRPDTAPIEPVSIHESFANQHLEP